MIGGQVCRGRLRMIYPTVPTPDGCGDNPSCPETLPDNDLRLLATQTLRAWEALQSVVEKLIVDYQQEFVDTVLKCMLGHQVTEICSKAGALSTWKYFPMMKVDGLAPPVE